MTNFAAFAARYRPWLEREARRLCVQRADMEPLDLVQDGLLRAWAALPRWRSGSGTLETWLVGQARYGMLDALRRMARPWDWNHSRRRETRCQVSEDALNALTVEDRATQARALIEMRARRLTVRQREVVALLLDDWTGAEIARERGWSESYVSQTYRAALAGMR